MVTDNKQWILTACSFLTDKATDWATHVIEAMERTPAIYTTYDAFVKDFRTRFKTVDEEADALVALDQLWMGKKTAQEYMSLFKQYADRTKLSDMDKFIWYRRHLLSYIKDQLAITDQKQSTLEELITMVQNIN